MRVQAAILRFMLTAAVLSLCPCVSAPAIGRPADLPRHLVSLDLPGTPADLIPADLNGDGLQDLVVILVYTEYDEIEFEEAEGFVQLTEIVPALFERREARAYLADAGGSLRLSGEPLPLPGSVISISPGPEGLGLLVMSDEGIGVMHLDESPGRSLIIDPLIVETPVLRGSRSFIPGLKFVMDLDGEGPADLLFPARKGPRVYRSRPGAEPELAADLSLPGDSRGISRAVWRRYPMPRVEDIDADGLPDLILVGQGSLGITVMKGLGEGRFAPPRLIGTRCLNQRVPAFFGDLDGDGRAEVVTSEELDSGKGEIKQAKQPLSLYKFHRLREDLVIESEPYFQMEVLGYDLGGDILDREADKFRDLDGDGRRDLVTVTLDFSMIQVLRILTTKKLGIGLDFHVQAQQPDGSFEEVDDLALSDKMLIDFNDLKLDRIVNFAADFDGDRRLEFLNLQRSRTVSIHRGKPGCRYAKKPDFVVELEQAPLDQGLVKIRDLDGDGLSDIAVTYPEPPDDPGASPPARLDLYLSRGLP